MMLQGELSPHCLSQALFSLLQWVEEIRVAQSKPQEFSTWDLGLNMPDGGFDAIASWEKPRPLLRNSLKCLSFILQIGYKQKAI